MDFSASTRAVGFVFMAECYSLLMFTLTGEPSHMTWCPGPMHCPAEAALLTEEETWDSLPRLWNLQAAEMRAESDVSEIVLCFLSASKVGSQGAVQEKAKSL